MKRNRNTESHRPERVAEQVRFELMNLILRGEIKDPRVQGVVITDVRMTKDLGIARVYLRLERPSTEAEQSAAVSAMIRAKAIVRRKIAAHVKLKYVPELEFFWDEQIDTAARLEQLFEEIHDQDRDESE